MGQGKVLNWLTAVSPHRQKKEKVLVDSNMFWWLYFSCQCTETNDARKFDYHWCQMNPVGFSEVLIKGQKWLHLVLRYQHVLGPLCSTESDLVFEYLSTHQIRGHRTNHWSKPEKPWTNSRCFIFITFVPHPSFVPPLVFSLLFLSIHHYQSINCLQSIKRPAARGLSYAPDTECSYTCWSRCQ